MLYFVYLRRPKTATDKRDDPFWEFGSFGLTGCHEKNLLHPIRSRLQNDDRLVFLQGGDQTIRAVGLTPPIEVLRYPNRLELCWDKTYQPLSFAAAPVLIDNQGNTDFPAVRGMLAHTNRSTYCGMAGSRFRGRTRPLEDELANQVLAYFERADLPRIAHYLEAVADGGSAWVRYGLKVGWADLDQRAQLFAKKGGVLPVLPSDVPAAMTEARRSRC